MTRKTPTLIGAGVGLALFLAVALLPALLYGGYAGVLLASGIFGAPVKATMAVRAIIVFGMVLGVTSIASLFAVAGAAAGAAVSNPGRPCQDREAGRGQGGREVLGERESQVVALRPRSTRPGPLSWSGSRSRSRSHPLSPGGERVGVRGRALAGIQVALLVASPRQLVGPFRQPPP